MGGDLEAGAGAITGAIASMRHAPTARLLDALLPASAHHAAVAAETYPDLRTS